LYQFAVRDTPSHPYKETIMDDTTLAPAAPADVIDPHAARFDAFVARGHQIITENLASARRLAAEYPQVAALMPAIEAALHGLFNHMIDGSNYEPTPEQQAALAAEQVNAQAAADRLKLAEDHAAALDKIEADRAAALAPPVVEPAPVIEEPADGDDTPIPPPAPSAFEPAAPTA
jgi:hypothetical protein